jgi:hypothetical protein
VNGVVAAAGGRAVERAGRLSFVALVSRTRGSGSRGRSVSDGLAGLIYFTS